MTSSGLDQMYAVLGDDRAKTIERFGGLHNNLMNMTYIALRFSRWVNGVAMQHGKVSQQMFPDYHVESVTNGVHAATWLAAPLQRLFDDEMPRWRHDNAYFRNVYGIKPSRIANAHRVGKRKLVELIADRTGEALNESVLTLGFARRVATLQARIAAAGRPQASRQDREEDRRSADRLRGQSASRRYTRQGPDPGSRRDRGARSPGAHSASFISRIMTGN